MRTGIVGLGAMGVGMARNLAKAGQLVAVYNRTPSKAEQLGNELDPVSQFSLRIPSAAVKVGISKDIGPKLP